MKHASVFAHIVDVHGLPHDLTASGADAIDRIMCCVDKPCNVFFIDWQMPKVDGIELTKRIKEITDENSVVFMSSVTDWAHIEKEALSAGVRCFVPKPLFPSHLIDAINRCFGVKSVKEEPTTQGMGNMYDFNEHSHIDRRKCRCKPGNHIRRFEETGVSINFADNGPIAVSVFASDPAKYSLIFMDIHMPEMDGYGTTLANRGIKSDEAMNIPIIAMTANVFKEDIKKCLAAGMNSHVGKPIDASDLIQKMDIYINGRK